MKKVKFSKARHFLKGKGFIIALVLSVGGVGVATYIAYNEAIEKISDISDSVIFTEEANAPVDKADNNVPDDRYLDPIVANTDAAVSEEEAIDEEEAEEANNFVAARPLRLMPVDGEIIGAFSNNELVKSATLGVWKTHDGVDIGAEMNAPVVAMSDGVVSEVYGDPLWGIAVVIDHGDGLMSHYYNLDKSVAVMAGAEIFAGDIIGSVGNSAEIEIAEPTHLHFALKKNGEWIDPIAYINE